MNELTQECLGHLQKEINKLKEEMEVLKEANRQLARTLDNYISEFDKLNEILHGM